jgi:hypothetical protein
LGEHCPAIAHSDTHACGDDDALTHGKSKPNSDTCRERSTDNVTTITHPIARPISNIRVPSCQSERITVGYAESIVAD